MAERRTLSFATLDRVMPDVDQLLEGHETLGNWSLGQICNHLATGITGSVDGFPFRTPWIYRKTLGAVRRRRVFQTGRMATGVQLPSRFCPKPGLDARAEAEALRATLRYYAGYQEPLAMHPIFGELTRDEWSRLHAIHCAHHLSFVLPRGSGN
ncbi:DUF1569 domain-containing protein [Singulisphaera acidiphila]|uniref:DUF1569 domain-containing protein n=1 Tax=Singulisphaera acidiphila (strain ATCC BAA-1392 / DSM 18658 / VKM B-2454 / MOB10) TaxID=886293 RepID=L0D8A1_SINAD|nr:DUF1569 domain-containing protein [Singulisphaera acidiphila]AGA25058.1 Protein of unknown function (DUF1569) [Singulisphaera acidiphila DSM 18658]